LFAKSFDRECVFSIPVENISSVEEKYLSGPSLTSRDFSALRALRNRCERVWSEEKKVSHFSGRDAA
jgi:hypothetical protein